MFGIAYTIKKDDKGNVNIPIERVVYEEELYKDRDKVTMKYVFDDYSSIIVLFSKNGDIIVERETAKYE